MKNLIVFAALISALGFTSCRKAYTCECSTSDGGSTAIVTKTELSKQALKDARAECDKGDSKIGSITKECEIKL